MSFWQFSLLADEFIGLFRIILLNVDLDRKKDAQAVPLPALSVRPVVKAIRALKPDGKSIMHVKKIIKMREMSDNQRGIIKKVSATGDIGRRIREMGLVPNTAIQIQGRAPLKDPVAIKIRDFTLTLRNNEANNILVEVEIQEK